MRDPATIEWDLCLVGGAYGDDPDTLTVRGRVAIEAADAVLYPGDWLGAVWRDWLGPKLELGRSMTADHVMSRLEEGLRVAVLFNGAQALFSGHDGFPDAHTLALMAAEAGFEAVQVAGVPSVQMALLAAGWSLCRDSPRALTVASPDVSTHAGREQLARLAETPDVLGLLWCEDHAPWVFEVLLRIRGTRARCVVVHRLGSDGTAVAERSLGEWADTTLEQPSVLLVGAAAEPDRPRVPDVLRCAAASWLERDAAKLNWLLAPPGTGKSSWLRAVEAADPTVRVLELASLGASLLGSSYRVPGGSTAMGHLASAVRALAEHAPERWVVATSTLPDFALSSGAAAAAQSSERLFVLELDEARWSAQLAHRDASQGIAPRVTGELQRQQRRVRSLVERGLAIPLRAPFVPELLAHQGTLQATSILEPEWTQP